MRRGRPFTLFTLPLDDVSLIGGSPLDGPVVRDLLRKALGIFAVAWLSLLAPGTSQALVTTVYAAIDNKVMADSSNPQVEQNIYSNSDLGIGCDWDLYYYDNVPYQAFLCARTLIWFDIDGIIQGKTIQSALLRVYPYLLPTSFDTSYSVAPILSEWHFDTVRWSNQPSAGSAVDSLSAPVTTVLPMEFDVTSAVQDWADGVQTNRGFRIRDTAELVFPYATLDRIVALESLEYWYATGRRPQLYLAIADVDRPTLDFHADPARIAPGGTSTLSWQTTNATACHTTTRNWSVVRMGINGTKEVVPLATSTYGIACSGPGGEVAKSVTVTVPEPAAAAAGLTALVALLSLGAKPRRRMPRVVAPVLGAALTLASAQALALPDPFPSRAVQQAAIASDGTRLVVFLRSHLDDPALPGKDDPGLLVEWNGATWSAPSPVTNECHEPDVSVSAGQVAMLWIDDTFRPNAVCDSSCRLSRLLSYDSAQSGRMSFVGVAPVASFTQVVGGNDRLYVERMDDPPLPGGPPELLGGTHCFDDPYFHCPSLQSPAITPDGSNWIAAYVAFALDGSCVGVRRGISLPETCLIGLAGASPHAVEIVLVNGEPFVLWAELSTGGRGTADRLNAARFDPVSGWVLADARVGLAAGDGLTWRRIRAVSDGAAVVALYERSDGALFARRWDSANGFVGARTLAAAGATSSDVTLHQGAPMAAYILAEHVVVEPVPEPALGSLGLVALASLVLVARHASSRTTRIVWIGAAC